MVSLNDNQVTTRPHVIVIGGGPAGATTSTLLAKQGHRVTLYERETFPRYHIGESLIPETFWVLERLGVLPHLKEEEPHRRRRTLKLGSTDREHHERSERRGRCKLLSIPSRPMNITNPRSS